MCTYYNNQELIVGLAASQVRLLSLTNRQHSIELEAQRLENFKLQLANDSDRVYQTYLNALDETTIKTLQTDNDTGETSWIKGTINNLMRYNTSEDTSGTVFYVQDISTGKLYIPEELGENYDEVAATGDLETDCRSYAELFGITYTREDYNEDILINYQNAIDNGWDTIMTSEEYDEYNSAIAYDAASRSYAALALSYIPDASDNGYYEVDSDSSDGSLFISALENIMESNYYDDTYTSEEQAVIEGAYNLMSMLTMLSDDLYSQVDGDSYEDYSEVDGSRGTATNHITVTYSFAVSAENSDLYIETDETEETDEETEETYETEETDETDETETDSDDSQYVSNDDASFSVNDIYEMMLNGGTATMSVIKTKTQTVGEDSTYVTASSSIDIYDYDSDSASGKSSSEILSDYNSANDTDYSNYAEALTAILTDVAGQTRCTDTFLSEHGLTESDITNYKKYLSYKSDYDNYSPDYYWVADDTVKAAYYEEIYAAITAAGGWIGVDDEQAESDSWVSNMIKNAEVILATYDSSEETLSRTTASINTNLKEVADDSAIEEAASEYEAETAKIDAKDTNYDTLLETLETERSSISTEIDSLKTIISDNIESNFKIMS